MTLNWRERIQVFIDKQETNRNFSNKLEIRRSSWNQTGKIYKRNIQLISKCLMCIKLAVSTLKLFQIEQENFDEISIAKS